MALEAVLSAPARSREVVNRVTKSSDSRVNSTQETGVACNALPVISYNPVGKPDDLTEGRG